MEGWMDGGREEEREGWMEGGEGGEQGRIQEFRKGGHRKGVGTGGGMEAMSNIAILTHIHNEKLALIT